MPFTGMAAAAMNALCENNAQQSAMTTVPAPLRQ
jgi:hypothetical protein